MRSTSGITCCHFFCSAVFSIPVCRYPIVVLAPMTVSPSSSSIRLSTPCVLGCCGPMLTVIVSLRSSATAHPVAFDVGAELFFGHLEGLVGLRRLLDLYRIVLAPRVPLPVLRHQQPPQVGVTGEDDPEHVPDFALGPSGTGPHRL